MQNTINSKMTSAMRVVCNRLNKNITGFNLARERGRLVGAGSKSFHGSSVNSEKLDWGDVWKYRVDLSNRCKGSCITRRFNSDSKSNVSESTILLQQDCHIQEVPVVVLKTDPTEIAGVEKGPPKPYIDLDPREEAAFVEAFNSYHTPQEVLRILDTIPSQEVTPFVSFSILKKLFELESNFGFRNQGKSWVVSVGNGKQETFARAAIVGRLMNTILASDDAKLILDTLDILRSESHQHFQDSDVFLNYHQQICDYVLVRATEGKLSLEETCRAVCSFGEIASQNSNFRIDTSFIDKLWMGIVDKGNDITVNNIVQVFKTVPYFQKSLGVVFNFLDKYLMTLWWRMDSDAVAQICDIISSKQKVNVWDWSLCGRTLKTLSRCTSLNMHQVTEDQLFKILRCFLQQNFCDAIIQSALPKYMKAKKDKITKPEVVTLVMDYVKKIRLRSPQILEAVAEFVVRHNGKNLSPPQITSIVTGFGHLNYQPAEGVKFWNVIEELLEDKFIQFTPRDMTSVLLACVYLEKYPLNFVSRIFSPYFLDRIHANEPYFSDLQSVRCQLKLLDVSLHLDCGWKYGGPYLPKDFSAYSLFRDGRVARAVEKISKTIEKLSEDECSLEAEILLPSLPLNELYIVDLLIIPMKGTEAQLYNFVRNKISSHREGFGACKVNFICVIINIPEHFTSDGITLVGPQAMRLRHLKSLGLTVVDIKYEKLREVWSQPERLEEFLTEKLNYARISKY